MVKEFPYKELQHTEPWNVVDRAIGDLEEIRDKFDRVGFDCVSLDGRRK
ncbi:hypothetical protein [Clostridium sp.]|nr:hypothetical protein [Clostridium sp.]MDR3596656.1 hypothetical protein [Clostridium sp.]